VDSFSCDIENMYSEYGALGGTDYRMLTNLRLRELQMMQQTTSMTSNWLHVLPMSTSQLTGDWRLSMRDIHKWRPTPVVVEMARCKPLNLNVISDETVKSSMYCGPRRRPRHSSDDGEGPSDQAKDKRYPDTKRRATVANGRRFDFTRLAESATRRDDSSTTAADTEIAPSNGDDGGAKVAKYDDDQSDRRLSLKPAADVEDADKRSLICSLPHRSTQPLKSVFNPIQSFDRYIVGIV